MRKILGIVLVSFLFMAMCVWSVGWFLQSREIKKQISSAMGQLDPAMGTLKAGEVSTSGFPLRMIVTITNPTVSLNLKPWLEHMHKRMAANTGNSAAVLTAPEYPEGTLDSSINGYARLSLNALSDVLSVELSGGHHMKLANTGGVVAIGTEYSAPTTCQIRLNRSMDSAIGNMWDLQKFFSSYELFTELRSMNCSMSPAISTDESNGQVIGMMDASNIAYTHTPGKTDRFVDIKINLKDYEIMPEGDVLLAKVVQAFTPAYEKPMPMAASLYGKQSLVLDANAQVAKDVKNYGIQPTRIEVKQLFFSSAAGTTNGSLLVSTDPTGGKQSGEIALNFASEFKPVQSQVAKMSVAQFAEEAYANEKLAKNIAHIDRATFESSVYDALPNITELGPLTQKLRFTFSGDPATKEGSFTLSGLEFSSRDYGILADGSGNMTQAAAPALNATLTCRNCLALVDTLANYLNRVERATAILSPETGRIGFKQSEIDGAKLLLAAVGTPENTNDLKFVIESKQEGIFINQKSAMELMMLMQQYLPPEPR